MTGLRTAVVAFAAALGAGIALLYTARTYRLTRRGQITDRFTKALERLGSAQTYVCLRELHLARAKLNEADLTNANLIGATLKEANLSEATLTEANLRGADLSRVFGLTVEQSTSAITNEATTMPAWLYPTVGPVPERR